MMSLVRDIVRNKKRREYKPYKEKSSKFLRFMWILTQFVLLIIFMGFILVSWLKVTRGSVAEYFSYKNVLKQLEIEEDALKIKVADLENRRNILDTDTFEIERIARERHMMLKPGENVIVFTPPTNK